MPYIKQELRDKIDPAITNLVKAIQSEIADENLDGVLNYTLTRVACGAMMPAKERRYTLVARVIAAFECAKIEIYRRIGAPYEDVCIGRNGDLEELR